MIDFIKECKQKKNHLHPARRDDMCTNGYWSLFEIDNDGTGDIICFDDKKSI
jgi:hypothetical protein